MLYRSLILAIVVIGYLNACVSRAGHQQPASMHPPAPIAVLKSIPAGLNGETYPPIDASETKIKGRTGETFEFKQAQFVDENHGWAMSGGSLYRTTDAGKSWERLAQQPGEDSRFSSFFFVDESRGWLVTVKHAHTEEYLLGYSSTIMVTDDGGRSWKLQASFPNEVDITEIRFLNRTEGFATGRQTIDRGRPTHFELILLKTSNAGTEWSDISEAAKTVIKEEHGIPAEEGQHLEWTPSALFLLTRFGKVISTTDGGKTWKPVAILKRERPHGIDSSPGYIKLAVDPGGKLRIVAAGPGGDYVGAFLLQEDAGWTSYILDLIPIRDAVFLSEKEVLACGLDRRPLDDKDIPSRIDTGVILRSFDSGRSWQPIYHSKSFETFFYLTKVKDNQFYAVSDTGIFLRFTLPSS